MREKNFYEEVFRILDSKKADEVHVTVDCKTGDLMDELRNNIWTAKYQEGTTPHEMAWTILSMVTCFNCVDSRMCTNCTGLVSKCLETCTAYV